MNKKLKRWVSIITLIVVMGGVAYYFHLRGDESDSKGEAPRTQRVQSIIPANAEIVRTSYISEDIVSVGSVIPDEIVDLTFETSGKVVSILFNEGSFVKEGDLLAEINDAPLLAQLERAQREIPLLEQRLYRHEELLKREAVSQEAYDIVSTDLDKLHADIDIIKSQIELTKLRAPFSGIIGLRNISEGTYATTGTSVATLTRTQPVKISLSYPERYTNQISKGTPIEFTVDGVLTPFKSSIYAIEPNIDSDIKTQSARAIYANSRSELTPGRFVNVRITVSKEDNAMTLPSQTIVSEVGRTIVYRYKGGKVEPVRVDLGIRTDARVEVIRGIQVGDTIITTGLLQMRPGLAVKLESIKDLLKESQDREKEESTE